MERKIYLRKMISPNIFRAYDIRGIYGVDLDEKVAEIIGRALAELGGEGKNFVVGRDVRLSSEPLGRALTCGMVSGGLSIMDIGVVTTPLLYFATQFYGVDGGVMVSASHNPPEWNGFKILLGGRFICMGMGMEDLMGIALKAAFKEAKPGSVKVNPNAMEDYMRYISKRVNIREGFRLAADPGGGSATALMPMVFERVGTKAYIIYGEPDGSFSKHPPEPDERTLKELRRVVLDNGAEFGISFDGDGDRAVFIDDRGRLVPSSTVLAILIKHYLSKNRGAPVVYEVSCSMVVEETIRALGGKPILSRVGHTYIYEKMISEGAVLGGEMSGHFYFKDIYGFDDGVYAGLKVAEAISEDGRKLSEIVDSIPKYPEMLAKNYICPDKVKFKVIDDLGEELKSLGFRMVTIDGIKVLTNDGWFLIRASNTQPLIRLTVEARDEEKLRKLTTYAEKIILEKMRKYC
ncbi:MAG: phosphomannomutase/phosphoglucomutase [Candidatus Bathyarchaeia archaeon]